MTQPETFQWHDHAALFAGHTRIKHPTDAVAQGFRSIAQPDLPQSLGALGAALCARDPFCVSQTPLPAAITAEAGDFLTLTGGSSGTPKIIRRTQASWIASFAVNAKAFAMRPGQASAVLGDLSHSLALYGVLEALHLGLDAHVLVRLSPQAQRHQLAQHRIKTLYATPTQLRLLLSGHPGAPVPTLGRILCGGGMLDVATAQAAQDLFPDATIQTFYGAAETSFVTLTDTETPQGSVGQPYRDVEVRIIEGEVFARSPYLFKGYATASETVTRTQDGFVSVGEMGSLDVLGNLWLQGRRSRMVRVAEHSVFPEQIEGFILTKTHANACAVLATADDLRGQQLAVVVPGPEDTELAKHIKDSCHEAFGPLIAPRIVLFHPDFPYLASGKPDLPALGLWLEDQI